MITKDSNTRAASKYWYNIYRSDALQISWDARFLDFRDHELQVCQADSNNESVSRSLTNEEWLDTDQAAVYLKVSVGTLRNMASNGHIPYHKLGKRNRYRTEDLRQLLLSHKRGVICGN